MLARANRVIRAADFRSTVRRGRRVGTSAAILHIVERPGLQPSRFGFIVTKAVGNSVTRNLVRRRLRSASRDALAVAPLGVDVVMRALPGAEQVLWPTLHTEIVRSIERSMTPR